MSPSSLSHDDFLSMIRCAAAHLNPTGVIVLEMSHPRDLFTLSLEVPEWTMAHEDLEVDVRWGEPDDPFDPVTQITQVTATYTIRAHGEPERRVVERAPQRAYSVGELHALFVLSGVVEPVAWYGALDTSVPLDDDPRAWRTVVILRVLTSPV